MSIPMNIKHLILKPYFIYQQIKYNNKVKTGKPVSCSLPKGMVIKLYPEGQIAECLYKSKYEHNDIELVITYLKAGMNVLDIGANIGIYSIIADKLVGATGHVWAFEPSTETHNRLLANLALNEASTVEPVKIALSDVVEAILTLKRDPGYKDGERYLSIRNEATSKDLVELSDLGDDEDVRVTTLDRYMHEGDGRPPKIDFIKMDVEGVEFSVLRGARNILTENPDILVFFECTWQGCELSGHKIGDVFLYLRELG
ncbi:MAG: FkbM family methyltransferase, partial [Methylococcales bacterium]